VADIGIVIMLMLYGTMALTALLAMVLAPFYILFELGRYGAGFLRKRVAVARATAAERDRATVELREQYAAGKLTMLGLEERLTDVLRAESHLEVTSVLDDLPRPRWTPRGAVAFDVCAGVALLLVDRATFALAIGALLSLGALVSVRGRVPAYAFLAGVALFVSPPAAVALTASAIRRWVDERPR